MPRQAPPDGFVFRVHSHLIGGQPCQRATHYERAPDGVLIEVQAQLARTAFKRRMVGAHPFNGAPHSDPPAHRRISTARACAARFSASASAVTAGARRRRPAREMRWTLAHFTKSQAESPPRARAHPPVGRT